MTPLPHVVGGDVVVEDVVVVVEVVVVGTQLPALHASQQLA
jgi:hypothetical protein